MKKLSLIAAAMCLLSIVSFAQKVTVDFNYNIYGDDRCSTGPMQISTYVRCNVTNVTPGSTINLNLSMNVNGVLNTSIDTVITAGSASVYIVFEKVMVNLTGPGTHVIEGIGTAKTGILTFTGSYTDTEKYGTSECDSIHGVLYLDKNANCKYDAGDSAMANQPIRVDYKKVYYTDSSGKYLFMNPRGYLGALRAPHRIPSPTMPGYFPLKCPDEQGVICAAFKPDTSYDFGYKNILVGSQVTFSTFNAFSPQGCGVPSPWYFTSRMNANGTYQLHLDFGDGEDTTIVVDFVPHWDSLNLFHNYTSAGTFNPVLTYTFKDTVVTHYLTNPIIVSGDCGSVSGRIYKDNNSNCAYDAGTDSLLAQKGVICKFNNRELYAFTNDSGHYAFQVENNVPYTLKLSGTDSTGAYINGPGYVACPANHTDSAASGSKDFGLQCSPSSQDFYVMQQGWSFRPGFRAYINVRVQNRSCNPGNGTLVYQLDPKETFISSNPAPARQSGGTLEWDYTGVHVMKSYKVDITVKIDSTTAIGDTVCHTATVTIAGDSKPEDNVDVYCAEVRGSYDPNDKTAYINNGRKSGNMMLNTDELLYRLRFQNTGTDTAFNIYLLDTIDPNLDLNTLEIIASSHKMKVSLSEERKIRFDFDNILLPDDKVNEPLSHGYVLYRIRPVKDLPDGIHIYNTGYIYFDYNLPIVTNTTDNVIGSCAASPEPAGTIIGSNGVCRNSPGITYSVPQIDNADGYHWVLPAGAVITSGQNTNTITVDFSNATSGNIYVKGTSNCGEGARSANFPVKVNEAPAVVANASSTTICAGTNITLTGGGASTYAWTGGVNNGVAFAPTETGTYTVTGIAANGCKNTASVNITVKPLPVVAAIASVNTVCEGEEVILSGEGAMEYTWTGGVTNGVPFVPVATTMYTVAGKGANGCTNTADITIKVNELPEVVANASSAAVCEGAAVTLTGSGAETYSWAGGITDGVEFVPDGTNSYSVTGTDLNGCENTASVTVTVNSLPTVDANATSTIVCSGDEVILKGSGALTYRWTGEVIDGVPFNPTETATYIVTGTNENGCENTAELIVTVNPLPEVSLGMFNRVCEGSASFTLEGGFPTGGTYTGTGVDMGNFDPAMVTAGVYEITYIYKDENGCMNSAASDLEVNPLPAVTLEPFTPVCSNAAAFILAGGMPENGEYSGPGVTEGMFDPAAAGVGTHPVIYSYTDENGCSKSVTSPITVDLCSGIGNNSMHTLAIYPNPFRNIITVTGLDNREVLELYNIVGEKLYSVKNNNKSEMSIQTGDLPAGVYILSVSSANGNVNTRIVKE